MFQAIGSRSVPAILPIALAIMFAASPATAIAQVTVLLPTEGDLQATLALPGDIRRGQEAYAECQTCHRKDASGRAKFNMPRLSGQHASVLIKQLMDIRSGLRVNPDMREYMLDSDLTLQDFADMAAYLQSLPVTGNIAKGPPELVPRGQALYASDCSGCHGEHGEGRGELFFPMLASQHYGYLLRELDLILTGERGNSNPAMPPLLKDYSADDKRALAAYLAQLPAPARGTAPAD
ncbi:MAG TPA: c-type cytochrome [Steroidobacteraceae bacterium]|nr:c-type cytochrome [Steroidobacteraceae bacterium]